MTITVIISHIECDPSLSEFHDYLDSVLAEMDATIEMKKVVDQLPSIMDLMKDVVATDNSAE